MRSDSGKTQSFWMDTAEVPSYPALAEDLRTDVCVIGAGIAGLSTAYSLAMAGKRVVVLDDGPVAGGETGRTTAHLAFAWDDFYSELEKVRGADIARLTAESHMAAVNRIEQVVKLESIDCDFTRLDGYLFPSVHDRAETIETEYEAVRRVGIADATIVERAPIPTFRTGRALRYPNQGQFHPVKYLAGLARAIEAAGGRIFCGTHVDGVEGGAPAIVKAGDRTVTADAVCVCTNSPISDYVHTHTKQAPYRTYVVAFRIPRGAVPQALYWDTADPYHYVRLAPLDPASPTPSKGGTLYDVLIVGGEDHKTGQADDMEERWRCLEDWTRERFPMVDELVCRWSGQVLEPVDFTGYIGPNPDGKQNVYMASGDSGQGMTHGTIAGLLLTDLVMGRDNPWAEVYDPRRVTVSRHSVSEFIKENVNVAAQLVKDYVTGGDVGSVDEIPRGEGRVIRRGAHKVAVFRDDSGTLHERSAACTHMKCIVDWNPGEKSWDCPCHGSRFDPYGKVLNGPAVTPLPMPE